MNVRHVDQKLARLEVDPNFGGGWGRDVIKAFRRRMQFIRDAVDERDFYNHKSLHYEKLKGNRSHERSIRLNDQYRLILRLDSAAKAVVVIGIEDYH